MHLGYSLDIDDNSRSSGAVLQLNQQVGSSGQYGRVTVRLLKYLDRLVNGLWSQEFRCAHAGPPKRILAAFGPQWGLGL